MNALKCFCDSRWKERSTVSAPNDAIAANFRKCLIIPPTRGLELDRFRLCMRIVDEYQGSGVCIGASRTDNTTTE